MGKNTRKGENKKERNTGKNFRDRRRKESKGKKRRYQVMNIERKGKKVGVIEDRRNGKFAQL